jgi:small-conductance mechanosensitive channel
MIDLDFTSNFTPFVAGAIRVGIIAGIALIIMLAIKKLVPKIITTRIPKIREESPDQLASRSKTLSQVIVQFATVIIWIIAGIMILSVVGVNITPILATVGVASLAIGLAAQNIIRDYLHGFFIIMEDWYRIGEVATVAGIGGLVENISLRRTILRDLNGTMHVIPNNKIELASNMTRDWSRVNLNISVSYNEDLSKVFSVINEVGKEMKEDPIFGQDLLTTPHAERVDNLGDSGIEIKVLADTKPIKQWGLMGELRKRLKDRFDQESIEIPWPHTKVYFGNTPTGIGAN